VTNTSFFGSELSAEVIIDYTVHPPRLVLRITDPKSGKVLEIPLDWAADPNGTDLEILKQVRATLSGARVRLTKIP